MGRKDYKKYKIGSSGHITALCDFETCWGSIKGKIRKGQKGGVVEGYHNLSQEGTCWVEDGAVVRGNAHISGDASISNSLITGNARVGGRSMVWGSEVSENALIFNSFVSASNVRGNAVVFDQQFLLESQVGGYAFVTGYRVRGVKEFDTKIICGIPPKS